MDKGKFASDKNEKMLENTLPGDVAVNNNEIDAISLKLKHRDNPYDNIGNIPY